MLIVVLSRNVDSPKPNIASVNLNVSTCSESLVFIQWNRIASLSHPRIRIYENTCFISPLTTTGLILFCIKTFHLFSCSVDPTSAISFKTSNDYFLELIRQTLSVRVCFLPFLGLLVYEISRISSYSVVRSGLSQLLISPFWPNSIGFSLTSLEVLSILRDGMFVSW